MSLGVSKSSRNSTLQLKSWKCSAYRSNHPGSTFLLRTHALAPAFLSWLEAIMEGLLCYGPLAGSPTTYDVAV